MEKYIVKSDEVWERYSDDLFSGYARMNPPVTKGQPWLAYIGPKIPISEWRKILAFFKWSYDDFKGEVQVRLYFNKSEKTWKAWAFPQEKSVGMSTKELEDKEGDERKKADLGKGWILGGTVHHHCGSSAYQSSVDKENESTQNGLHVTVGDLDKGEYSLHGRLVFRGTFYDVNWSEWFLLPENVKLEGVPLKMVDQIVSYFLKEGATKEDSFPMDWRLNVIKRTFYSPPYGQTQWTPHQERPKVIGYKPNGEREDAPSNDEKSPDSHTSSVRSRGKGKPLGKKERKLLNRLLARASVDDVDTDQITTFFEQEEAQKLQQAAVKTVQICASYNIEVRALFRLIDRAGEHMSEPDTAAALELEEILDKFGVNPVELEDWITQITVEESNPIGE